MAGLAKLQNTAARKFCLLSMRYKHRLAEVQFLCRLAGLANWLIKAERELWGLLEGPWAGLQGNNQRVIWGQQVLS